MTSFDPMANIDMIVFFVVLALVLVLFVWNRWRYDIVALVALLFLTLVGIVPASEAFLGFAHPAVITVAAVLIVSRGLLNSGLIQVISKAVSSAGDRFAIQLLVLTLVVTVLSAFMNNVGALALLMPVAIRIARKSGRPVSLYLMPLAFGSLLGGLTTLIGTPPNIIIAMARAETGSAPFGMFDFSPVGLSVCIAGLIFVVLLGWRLMPQRDDAAAGELVAQIKDYITEVRVPEDSVLVGKRISDIAAMSDSEVVILTLFRGQNRFNAPSPYKLILADDVLVVKGCAENIKTLLDDLGLLLLESREFDDQIYGSDEVELAEMVISQDSFMIGKTVRGLRLHNRHGINLLAISRQGRGISGRLDSTRLKQGDLLLVQGPRETLTQSVSVLGLLPLASRDLDLGKPRRVLLAVAIFSAGIIVAALDVVPIEVALLTVAVIMVLIGMVPVKEFYKSIDWPVIVLLGAMIPVGAAMEAVGGSELIADIMLGMGSAMTPHSAVIILMVATLALSNILNNAAVAVLMAPLSIQIASGLGVSADPLLMAVAIGASCAFLTPIGHQSNALVMGPGGYRFTDYWHMGLPLSVLVVVMGLISIFAFWPF
ncbi:MAG: SLC13 family permease [Candidatus Methanomethylophilaceae archaeon]|nr:SLC13 family permease [Candidatus Methanomethylophilaceae archaeon]